MASQCAKNTESQNATTPSPGDAPLRPDTLRCDSPSRPRYPVPARPDRPVANILRPSLKRRSGLTVDIQRLFIPIAVSSTSGSALRRSRGTCTPDASKMQGCQSCDPVRWGALEYDASQPGVAPACREKSSRIATGRFRQRNQRDAIETAREAPDWHYGDILQRSRSVPGRIALFDAGTVARAVPAEPGTDRKRERVLTKTTRIAGKFGGQAARSRQKARRNRRLR